MSRSDQDTSSGEKPSAPPPPFWDSRVYWICVFAIPATFLLYGVVGLLRDKGLLQDEFATSLQGALNVVGWLAFLPIGLILAREALSRYPWARHFKGVQVLLIGICVLWIAGVILLAAVAVPSWETSNMSLWLLLVSGVGGLTLTFVGLLLGTAELIRYGKQHRRSPNQGV